MEGTGWFFMQAQFPQAVNSSRVEREVSKNYTVWYHYQEHVGSGNVVEQLWNQLQAGQAIEITYLRDDPASSRPIARPFTECWTWLILLVTGGLIVVVFVGLWVWAGWMWSGRYKARVLPPQPFPG